MNSCYRISPDQLVILPSYVFARQITVDRYVPLSDSVDTPLMLDSFV